MAALRGVIILLSCILSLCCYAAGAKEAAYIHLTKENCGLSCDNVRCLFQDSKGYLWVGTEMGLNRYDGTRWVCYGARDYSLPSNYIFSLAEDGCGNIWFGTAKGAAFYNRESDSFVVPKMMDGSYPQSTISSFSYDSSGIVYFSPDEESILYCYDACKGHLESRQVDIEAGAKYLSFDKNDRLIFISGFSLYTYDPQIDSLHCAFGKVDNPRSIRQRLRGPVVSPRSNNIAYVCTEQALLEVNLISGVSSELLRWTGDRYPISFVLDKNSLLISTSSGLLRYDISTGKSCIEIDGFFVMACSVPRGDASFWAGTQDSGLFFFGPELLKFNYISLGDSDVSSIVQASERFVYLTTLKAGLIRYDLELDRVDSFPSAFGLPSSLNVAIMDDDNLLVGGDSGLYVVTEQGNHVRLVFSGAVSRLLKTHSGEIIVGNKNTLWKLKEDYSGYSVISDFFLPPTVSQKSIVEDLDGVFWMPTYLNGVYSYNPSTHVIKNYLADNAQNEGVPELVSSILINNDGSVWTVGHDAELCKINPRTGECVKYDYHTYRYFPQSIFLSALQEKEGRNIWVATSSGLVCFDPSSLSCITYTTKNGLKKDAFLTANCVLYSGEMLFATKEGLLRFNPAEISSKEPQVDLVSISVGDTSYRPGEIIGQDHMLSIPFAHNSFGFSFATPGLLFPASIKFWLEGFDVKPRMLGNDKDVFYYNIPPGSYVLHVDGCQDLMIEVVPPFWTSWKGILLIVLGSLLICISTFLFFVKRKAEKERKKAAEIRMKEKMDFLSGFVALEQFEVGDDTALFMQKMDDVVTRHLSDENFGVEQLASELCMSHRTLTRHSTTAFRTTPNNYIRIKRLAVANHLLKIGDSPISEIASRCGFSSQSYFAKCYKDIYGRSPSSKTKK